MPIDRVDADEPEYAVDQAGVATVELTEHDRDGGDRGDDRNQHPEPEQQQRPDRPVEQRRHDQCHQQLRHGGQHEQPQRVDQRIPEVRIPHQPRVVAQPNKPAIAREIPGPQRNPRRITQREQPKHREQQEERRNKHIRRPLQIKPTPPPPPRTRQLPPTHRPPGRPRRTGPRAARRAPGGGRHTARFGLASRAPADSCRAAAGAARRCYCSGLLSLTSRGSGAACRPGTAVDGGAG